MDDNLETLHAELVHATWMADKGKHDVIQTQGHLFYTFKQKTGHNPQFPQCLHQKLNLLYNIQHFF